MYVCLTKLPYMMGQDRHMTLSYPRLAAKTLRFTLGLPRNIGVSQDGRFVRFIRTPDGVTRTGQLWELDAQTGSERLIVDPAALLDGDEELSAAERARRERSRESAAGLTSWASDTAGLRGCFALSGRLFLVDFSRHSVVEIPAVGPVIDPQLNPQGTVIAYANAAGEFRIVNIESGREILAMHPDTADQSWGQAEFIATEEMSRFTGFWWSPDGNSLLVQHTDESSVPIWHIADPANPDHPPREQRYPAAGTNNAIVSLWHVDLTNDTRTQVMWDREKFEYLARVSWSMGQRPIIQVLSRDQKVSHVLDVEPESGETTLVRDLQDTYWVELASAPRRDSQGRLITLEDMNDRRRIAVDGTPISSTKWQVRGIVDCFDDSVVVTASQEPTSVQVVRFGHDGSEDVLTTSQGVHSAVIGGPTTVIVRSSLDTVASEYRVHCEDGSVVEISTAAEPAPFLPKVSLLELGPNHLSVAVLFPRDHTPGSRRLPLLLDPYGGPHAQRVMSSARMFMESQWLADQGFCVVVADGRGTPGRGHAWEREIYHEFASVTLEDQTDTVAAITEQFADDVDPDRVGIIGWSYGGYLAALAVLERPDVFTAAVAGAPVTDWTLYDTCYTERYLGNPNEVPEVYARNSLIAKAHKLKRPLMLIHGLADDNVVAAHTLRLSAALLAAGKPHTVLPLSGVTHMTPQEEVAENLKLVQMDFLRRSLA